MILALAAIWISWHYELCGFPSTTGSRPRRRRSLVAMDADEDLGPEQEERLEEDGPVDEADLDDDQVGRIHDPELAEDLRRAQTNPPLTTPRAPDPYSDMDRGYLEDAESRDLTEELDEPLELRPEDPLEAEREEQDRPHRRL